MHGDLRHFGDLLRRNARLDGSGPDLALSEERFIWRHNDVQANRLAPALARRGFRHDDRVAIPAWYGATVSYCF